MAGSKNETGAAMAPVFHGAFGSGAQVLEHHYRFGSVAKRGGVIIFLGRFTTEFAKKTGVAAQVNLIDRWFAEIDVILGK